MFIIHKRIISKGAGFAVGAAAAGLCRLPSWTVTNAPGRFRAGIGVVKDAVVDNPFAKPEPSSLFLSPPERYQVTYRLAPTVSISAALARIRPIFQKYNRDSPFYFNFMDDLLASNYSMEVLIGRLAGIFAGLAVFISCLGLFGLAAYVAEQRTKEIGIRKYWALRVASISC